MKTTKIIVALLALVSLTATAQQDPQYTNYMYNTININPAYAGSRGSLSIFGLHRSQWVGIDGAPTTNSFSVNTPLGDSKVGLGVSFVNDALGVMDENTISVDFSYTLDLNNQGSKLSFGLKGSANLLSVAYSDLNKYNPNDPQILTDISSEFTPNIGAGIYWHNEKSYLGFSVPHFLETTRYNNNVQSTMQQKMHYYLMGGHVFEINPTLKFKPAFLFKAVSGAPLQADVTANFLIHDKFTLGAAYRWDAAWSALAGFQITNGFFVGYSYDNDIKALSNYNSGSHEIFLRFELFNKYRRVNSPRFF
ncbi:type IX secretion system membrane protein PorP/SprF [Flavobacterium sp. xlx-214]|uniref:PorP/SprF family type IX secretion system membrane protein n=1 Tax=unclassified Flavobacterium TaxID=196869 RepID=UPI0013D7165F|nr:MULTISPECIES: type IX secretion system membrane protein PorP/SprF [unclassified Flavobacterium]MBA5793350.1 type IX secretion system membrane protein PorP/SprF [Flavobacterium sp. xlx-221]QMI84088.1 type IX secretion system membrane protein PorP/SprF [Flavobacterium sp. xlx-214]